MITVNLFLALLLSKIKQCICFVQSFFKKIILHILSTHKLVMFLIKNAYLGKLNEEKDKSKNDGYATRYMLIYHIPIFFEVLIFL